MACSGSMNPWLVVFAGMLVTIVLKKGRAATAVNFWLSMVPEAVQAARSLLPNPAVLDVAGLKEGDEPRGGQGTLLGNFCGKAQHNMKL
jgi:hypothetical protein